MSFTGVISKNEITLKLNKNAHLQFKCSITNNLDVFFPLLATVGYMDFKKGRSTKADIAMLAWKNICKTQFYYN